MSKLQVLSPQLADMIAAGEVVQRPASVVKELMENAVDAGASQIQVLIKDSGRTSIRVIDNGCGMSPEDALLCFARHATSKINTPSDLEEILTYGFRGEALASIAAVSEVVLRTRREEDEVGTQVEINSRNGTRQSAVSCSKGTSIEVRNIFYNVPARRKFLKSDSSELKHIIEEFVHIALTRPDLNFTLSHNDKPIYTLKKAQGLKFRILDILGPGVVGEIVDLMANTSIVSLQGYIGSPDGAKKSLGNQYLFVNGRYFKSGYLHKAIMNAYSEMLPEGLTPSYFIYLTVDPHSIDVNVSPTKTEIKFENDFVIFQTLYACVRETLGRNGFGAMIDFDAESALQMPVLNSRETSAFRPEEITAALGTDSDYNPFETGSGTYVPKFKMPELHDYSALFEEKEMQQPKPSHHMVLGGKYIVTPRDNSLLITNIYRAQVRILYENMLSALNGEQNVCQTALFPVQVQIGAAYIPLVEANLDRLHKLGFDISIFGTDTIVVAGIPQGYDYDELSVKSTVADLLQILSDGEQTLDEAMKTDMARKLAERGGSQNARIKSPEQAQGLLDLLFACSNPETTPSGKRITKIVSTDDLEKLF